MNSNFFRQNKVLISVVFTLFLIVGSVVFITAKQIYELEITLEEKNDKARLETAKEVLEIFFAGLARQLLFLKDIPVTRAYVDSGFTSFLKRDEVLGAFHVLTLNYPYLYRISIIDPANNEMVKVENDHDGHHAVAADGGAYNIIPLNYINYPSDMKAGDVYVSSVNLNAEQNAGVVTYIPSIDLATPLFDSKGARKGFLVINIFLSKVFSQMPEDIFLNTEEGDIISFRPDGTLEFDKSKFTFVGRQGKLDISGKESIHYLTADILSIRKILLGNKHDLSLFRASMIGLAMPPASLVLLFISLIGLVAYLNVSRYKELVLSQKTLIHSLADLTEYRDNDTGYHLKRTKHYAIALTRQLRKNNKYRNVITEEFIQDIADASPLHDIGKVGIKDAILLKPGKLTDEEYEKMKKHVYIGKDVLDRDLDEFKTKQSFLIMGRNICAYHHEKYDGTGYIGLKGEKIPLEARIFALCDAYDAIRASRPYEGEVPHEKAVERIMADRGKHFDPDIVDAFMKCSTGFFEISNSC
ncbi:MAG: HD domain-containing protein [Nitrospirae bacterium]|nr:HD domain-containing protein [Nitrospirota bacterium]